MENAPGFNKSGGLADRVSKAEVYFEIEFPAWHYKISNGVLQYTSNTGTASFLDPMLFTSMNDLIIDHMIDESSGAIPVNEIPEGALLQIGDNYYQAVGGDEESKVFVGYAPIYEAVTVPQLVHAAKSFTSQMIYAGNQYINVCHFMESLTILRNNQETTALENVVKKTLSSDGKQRYSIDVNGEDKLLPSTSASTATEGGAVYTPIKIRFLDGLLAYKGTAIEEMQSTVVDGGEGTETITPETGAEEEGAAVKTGGTDTYILCNHTETSQSGALSDIPFLTDDVLNVSLFAVTADAMSAGFQLNQNAPGLRESIQLAFQKVFAQDFITLIRMLVFIVLMWLVIVSWMCYFLRQANLLPILEAIRSPSADRSKKGVDLMQVVSLGTINLDTEFTLGRFIQYNAILCALLVVIRLTG